MVDAIQKRSRLRKAFGKRLTKLMIEKGYGTARGSLGADPIALQEAAKVVSRDMARRYLKGEAFPEPDRLYLIAKWLDVSPEWLAWGEVIDQARLTACVAETLRAAKESKINLDPDRLAEIVAQVYVDQDESPLENNILKKMLAFLKPAS
jgi:transcriptional regulator with XRE-family HTH domain